MPSSRKIPVIIALGDFASGVTSWALRLREAFANHPRYVIRLMNCTDTGNHIGTFDLHATTQARASALLSACGEAIVLPNFVWDLFPVCAERIVAGQQLRCVGFCRADSEKEYYGPLRWYAPLCSQFAGVSPVCAATLVEQLSLDPSRVHTLPTGVWVPARLERSYQTTPLRLAYGGRIVQEQKRVMDFIPLVEKLYHAGVDFQFTIVGAGRQREELKSALAAVDPDKRVYFAPRRKPETMATFWAAQDVFVQTSAFEGTSNSMLESMAQGAVPVVTRTESGVAGIVEDGENGFLVDVGDMNGMVSAITTLAQDAERLAAMGCKAHETTFPYSMESYVEKFTALLDAAMTDSPHPWPDDRPIVPSAPFHGIRLVEEDNDARKGRIAILFPSPLRGGAEDYTLRVAAGAVRAGYDVQGAFPAKVALKGLIEDYFRVGAFHNTLEICDVGAKTGQAPIYKRFTRTVRLLRRLKPRAVLFQLCGIQYGLVSLLACACLRMPTLVVFQLVRDDLHFSPMRRMIHRWIRRRGQQYVAVSQANRRLLATAFSMKEKEILVIPNGVDLRRFGSVSLSNNGADMTPLPGGVGGGSDVAPLPGGAGGGSALTRTLQSTPNPSREGKIEALPSPTTFCKHPCDADRRTAARCSIREELGLAPDALLCLTVGRLSSQKGHDVLVPAIPHIVAAFPEVHFLWAGEGPMEKQLRTQLEGYRATPHVTFLGKRDDILELLQAADLFVHPARFEGQPFSLLEAMAAGLPVVGTTASGITEVVDPGVHGLLCRPDDICALRETLLRALGDLKHMKTLAEAARERVKTFSEEAMVTQTLAALEALAERP